MFRQNLLSIVLLSDGPLDVKCLDHVGIDPERDMMSVLYFIAIHPIFVELFRNFTKVVQPQLDRRTLAFIVPFLGPIENNGGPTRI